MDQRKALITIEYGPYLKKLEKIDQKALFKLKKYGPK